MPSEQLNGTINRMDDGMPVTGITNDATAHKAKHKLVRRALSMPRNLFRLSRRVKLTNSSKSTKQRNFSNNEKNAAELEQTMNGKGYSDADAITSETFNGSSDSNDSSFKSQSNEEKSQQRWQQQQSTRNRLFHRSTWKKFLARLAHQMTSSNNSVSLQAVSFPKIVYFFFFSIEVKLTNVYMYFR